MSAMGTSCLAAVATLGTASFRRRLRHFRSSACVGLRFAGWQRGNPGPHLRSNLLPAPPPSRRVAPRQARYFLVARQESTQRSVPRLPGPTASGYPRCGRPAGPAAKLAARCAVVVGQRDRTTPGEPPSLGGSEGNENRRVCQSVREFIYNVAIFSSCKPLGYLPL